ncbi:MAG: hypothetical protein D6805_02525 [Planctomycetota bacterium]|nr:MAG: hypothetical protein D6805_02525 [Planctomycetota bacterium]
MLWKQILFQYSFYKAQFFFGKKQYKKACQVFKNLLASHPFPPFGLHLYYGLSLAKLGELDAAQECLQKELQQYPHSPITHLFLGKILYKQNSLPQAKENFQKILQHYPHNALAKDYLKLLEFCQQPQTFLPSFNPLNLVPDAELQANFYQAVLQNALRQILHSKNMTFPSQEESEQWKQKLQARRNNFPSPSGKGDTLTYKAEDRILGQDFSAAQKYAQQALTLEPQNPQAHLYLGYSLFRQNQLTQARKHLLASLKYKMLPQLRQDIEFLYIFSTLASTHLRLGNLRTALHYSLWTENIDPQDWEGRLCQAEVLLALGNMHQSSRRLEELFSEDPEEFGHRFQHLCLWAKEVLNPSTSSDC